MCGCVCTRERFFFSFRQFLIFVTVLQSVEHVGVQDHFGAIAELALAVKILSALFSRATAQYLVTK